MLLYGHLEDHLNSLLSCDSCPTSSGALFILRLGTFNEKLLPYIITEEHRAFIVHVFMVKSTVCLGYLIRRTYLFAQLLLIQNYKTRKKCRLTHHFRNYRRKTPIVLRKSILDDRWKNKKKKKR